MLDKLLAPFDGVLTLRFPDNSSLRFGRRASEPVGPDFGLSVRDPSAVQSLLLGRDPLRFVDAYFEGRLDIDGDLFAALALKDQLPVLRLAFGERLRALACLLRARRAAKALWKSTRTPSLLADAVQAHTRAESRRSISFHYDLSNDFYRLWLDPAMVYSCAYFEWPGMSLEQAQYAKLDHICRKLRLQPGEHFLDIGCGWGALVLHAAQHYGVQAHGITLSQRQCELAQQRIAQAGLQSQVTVDLCDYRDLQGQARFEKIASVGMFEHVGLRNLPIYFGCAHRLLKAQGAFLNHGITHDVEGWGRTLSTQFINRYVFPGRHGAALPMAAHRAAAQP
jgi:cyclopropane-fatty-acyl-phospholipid synthase